MRLTADGKAIHGTWGVGVRLDGQLISIPESNHGRPLGDRIIYQSLQNGMPVLREYPGDILIDSSGASFLRAGAYLWGASLTPGGCRTNYGYTNPTEVIIEVAPDDDFYTIDHQQGQNITIRSIGGTAVQFFLTALLHGTPEERVAISALAGRRCVYVEGGGQVKAYNLPTFKSRNLERIYWVKLEEFQGQVYILELSERLTVRPIDSLDGWVISTQQTFNPDLRATIDGRLLVGWATGVGEAAATIQQLDITSPKVSLESSPIPAPMPSILQAYPRKMDISTFFSFSEKYGDTDDVVGNVLTIVADETDPSALNRTLERVRIKNYPLIVGPYAQGRLDQVAAGSLDVISAWWVGAGNVDELRPRLTTLLAWPEKRIIAYLDGADWPLQAPWLTEAIIPQLQAYRRQGESLSACEARLRLQLERMTNYGRPLAICFRADTATRGEDELVNEDFPMYDRLIRDFPIIVVQFFADRREGGGLVAMKSGQKIRQAAKAMASRVPLRLGRFDGWRGASLSPKTRLLNKLGQDVELINLDPKEKQQLRTLVETYL